MEARAFARALTHRSGSGNSMQSSAQSAVILRRACTATFSVRLRAYYT